MKTTLNVTVAAVVLFTLGAFTDYKIEKSKTITLADDKELTGAGATFPFPLYSKLFDEYNKKTGIKVNYQSIGSGGGIKQLQAKTVDFGASDAPMSDEELKSSPAPIVHVPTCLGADVVTYNIPGEPTLMLSGEVVAEIFLGKITKWNDAKITKLNPGAKLPDLAISVVHRSDGSGTTYIFSDYLSKVSPEWNTKPGKGKSLEWPVGLGAKGNEGVSGLVKQTPGSIGYVELIFALQNKMPMAKLKNKSGNFVEATLASVSAAANVKIPDDARVSITNTDAKDGYPISSFTYLLVYKDQNYNSRTEAQAKNTLKLVSWTIHEGQAFAAPLMYAPLPKEAVAIAEKIIKSVSFNGKPVL
ncbi:MAG: phosphate ABC transporter substrate-binding protein PstS [Bacteroidia bacterium]